MLEFNETEAGSLWDFRTYEAGCGGDIHVFIVALNRMGRAAGYISRLGDDDFSKIFLDLWKREGI